MSAALESKFGIKAIGLTTRHKCVVVEVLLKSSGAELFTVLEELETQATDPTSWLRTLTLPSFPEIGAVAGIRLPANEDFRVVPANAVHHFPQFRSQARIDNRSAPTAELSLAVHLREPGLWRAVQEAELMCDSNRRRTC